jgi:alkaline phosphatase D
MVPLMTRPNRRQFLATAAALGASAAWGGRAVASKIAWTERRDLYAEGVASGDPGPTSVILWTRRAGDAGKPVPLTVEVAEDEAFARVVATARTETKPEVGWTTRVLVGGLKPRREYWYRFTDDAGAGSRLGRTITAPTPDDPSPLSFSVVSCQNINLGAQHAYQRMIREDVAAKAQDRLGFVVHLGDFIYELVFYPSDRTDYYDRKTRDIVRYENGRKIGDFHIPTTLDDYRACYCAYLRDPDIQDARARWPFVAIGDNHEFSWQGWQSTAVFNGKNEPAQALRVAANQAWFEHQPAHVKKPGAGLNAFHAPKVENKAPTTYDAHGLGQEPNNLAAIGSITTYRSLRFGKHLDLILTDLHSYRSEEPTAPDGANAFTSRDFPNFFPEEVQIAADAGRTLNGGKPPATIKYGDKQLPNFAKDAPAQTILGEAQAAWFLDRLKTSKATWKVWGATQAILDMRADPQNLPPGLTKPWPGAGYATFGGGDYGAAFVERGRIYDFIKRENITGFAAVSGDRHSFWAGRPSHWLPPGKFEPVGVAFVTGSISTAGAQETTEHNFPKVHPLRPLFLADRPTGKPAPTINMLLRHGVRASLEYAKSFDLQRARALSNPDNAPHLDFVDTGGHGYGVVTVSEKALTCDFVCIPRPVERLPDGGPLRYRVRHEAALWRPGAEPKLKQTVLEGDPGLSI